MLDWTKWLKTHDSNDTPPFDSNDTPPSLEPGYGSCTKCTEDSGPLDYKICIYNDSGTEIQFKVWDPTYQDSSDHNYVGPIADGDFKCSTFSLGKNMTWKEEDCGCTWVCSNMDSTGCSYKLKIDVEGATKGPYNFNGQNQTCKIDSQSAISLTDDYYPLAPASTGLANTWHASGKLDASELTCTGPSAGPAP